MRRILALFVVAGFTLGGLGLEAWGWPKSYGWFGLVAGLGIGWLTGQCPHPNRTRERRDGRLYLVCEACGDAVVALGRTEQEERELAGMRRFDAANQPKARRVGRGEVYPMSAKARRRASR